MKRSPGIKYLLLYLLVNSSSLWAINEVDPNNTIQSAQQSDFTIDVSTAAPITGLWWNSNESGWGVTLTQQFDIIFATLFTYDTSGKPIWYVASNCTIAGRGCSGELYEVRNGTAITSDWDGTNKQEVTVGSVSFIFTDTNSGTMSFTINGVSGSKVITRQIWSSLSPGAAMTALWWNENESGWGVTLTQQTDIAFATMFTYDASGSPTWYVASNCAISGSSCTGALYEVTGGSALTQEWDGTSLVVSEVGNINFTFADADTGVMDFTLNSLSGHKELSRQIWSLGAGNGDYASDWIAGQFEPASYFEGLCLSPRSGVDPSTGIPYQDSQGTAVDENNWLRSWSNDLYLWYDDIVDRDPFYYATPTYFDLLKTFEMTPSGNLKDKFHFSHDTEEWRLLSGSGVSAGYGATFAIIRRSPPREVVVAYTDPGSPATSAPASLSRGTRILEIDGVDVENGNNPDALNAGLFPSIAGESHRFSVQDPGSLTTRTFTIVSAAVTSTPVQHVQTIETSSGRVGYMLFNDHIATSERLLADAISWLRSENISDLILDLRYNGGGYLAIASQLAYMVAGPGLTAGEAFYELQFNDKHTEFDPVTGQLLGPLPFLDRAIGLSVQQGYLLPSLGLSRLYVLTGPGTCSASEAIINGLRGVDIDVIQIGSTTCGKPYGFYPEDNCGTTYFSVQFSAINAKGFGDYTDGFSPNNTNPAAGTKIQGCSVADDFTHALGDPLENRLAAALAYRINQTCPTPGGFAARSLSRGSTTDLSAVDGIVHKSPWLENMIIRR